MNLTYENHLDWYLDTPDNVWATRSNGYQKFVFTRKKATRGMLWYSELLRAMRLLLAEHGSTLNVFYSGGFDSEILVRTLHEIGATVIAHTIYFDGAQNSEETDNCSIVCRQLGIKHVKHLHNLKDFCENRVIELGVKYSCSQIAYLTVLNYVEKIDDYPVLMGGEIYIQKHHVDAFEIAPSKFGWYYIYREDEDGVTYRYSKMNNKILINETFSYTPELILAWQSCETVQNLIQNKIFGKLSLLSSKKRIFREIYPYELQAKKKLHGYEKLIWTNETIKRELKSYLPVMDTYKELL